MSFYVNLLLTLSLCQSILIIIFTSWIWCLWGGVPCCQHIPASGGHLTNAWRSRSMFSKWRLSFWTFPFCSTRCYSAVSHPQQYSIATGDTVVPMNSEVPTKYRLSHNDRTVVLEICLHRAKARCSTDQRSMATEVLWVSLEGRSRTNSQRQRFHSQLSCEIVRYFWRNLYFPL